MRIQFKYSTVAITVIFVGLIGGFLISKRRAPSVSRSVASVSSKSVMDSLAIKTQTIEALQWSESEKKISLHLQLPAKVGCDSFSQASVFVRPEGLSEDGEVTSFEFPASCQQGHFVVEFSKDIEAMKSTSVNKPDFFETPKQFVISQVVLTGGLGKMSISHREIEKLNGKSFQFETTK